MYLSSKIFVDNDEEANEEKENVQRKGHCVRSMRGSDERFFQENAIVAVGRWKVESGELDIEDGS